jgi:hypothetical protein
MFSVIKESNGRAKLSDVGSGRAAAAADSLRERGSHREFETSSQWDVV